MKQNRTIKKKLHKQHHGSAQSADEPRERPNKPTDSAFRTQAKQHSPLVPENPRHSETNRPKPSDTRDQPARMRPITSSKQSSPQILPKPYPTPSNDPALRDPSTHEPQGGRGGEAGGSHRVQEARRRDDRRSPTSIARSSSLSAPTAWWGFYVCSGEWGCLDSERTCGTGAAGAGHMDGTTPRGTRGSAPFSRRPIRLCPDDTTH